jgi:outer membrane protein assembly factor BamB
VSTDLEEVRRALPDYEVSGEVGRGQFGVVWQGRHLQLRRDVAIKHFAGVATAEYHARFQREARLLAQISHPHVVAVYDYREVADTRLLVMELLPGGTFADRRAALSTESVIASTLAAASGLHAVHAQGVLHRDVKPENLLFDRVGVLKVTDFGVARGELIDATVVNVTHAGEFFGTPAYAAPEQAAAALGETAEGIDAAADQYSLAAVLYETLSGQLTHDATGGAVALCRRRVEQDARPLRDAAPDTPRAIEAVVMRALVRNPSQRFETTEAFGVALATATTEALGDGWLARSEVQLRAAGPVLDAAAGGRIAPTPRREPPRRKGVVIGAVAALVLAAAIVGGIGRLGGDDSNSGTSSPTTVVAAAQLTKRWSAATGGRVFSSPASASDLVVVGSYDNSVHALDARSGTQRWRRVTKGPVRSSPTIAGNRVFIGSDDGDLYALDLASGDAVWTANTGFKLASSPAVDADIVVVGADRLYAYDAATGRQRWVFSPKDVVASSPAIANDVVVVGSNDNHVYGIARSDGTERWHLRTGGRIQSSPVIVGGVAFVGSLDGFLYAIDVANGETRWATDLGAPVNSSPGVDNGRVIVGTDGGKLIAVDLATGAVQWSFTAGDSIQSSPVVTNGLVAVGSNDGKLYVVRADTGVLVGTFTTNGPVLSSPVATDGAVAVGSDDGSVYSVELPAPSGAQ